MADYSKLSTKDLQKAVRETREGIQRGRDLFDYVNNNAVTLGLKKVADSTPALMHTLEKELRALEDELDKKSKP